MRLAEEHFFCGETCLHHLCQHAVEDLWEHQDVAVGCDETRFRYDAGASVEPRGRAFRLVDASLEAKFREQFGLTVCRLNAAGDFVLRERAEEDDPGHGHPPSRSISATNR